MAITRVREAAGGKVLRIELLVRKNRERIPHCTGERRGR